MREKLNIRKSALRTPAESEKGSDGSELNEKIRRSRRMVRGQAALAVGTLLVVVILLFAMTSAWYTNVSRTSTLTFHAESWGFDPSKITVDTTAEIAAAPGRSGTVPITVDNSIYADPVKIYVTVNKTPMTAAMQSRIYFFADTSAVKNGENVSRVYVGSRTEDAYPYEILPGGTLTLSDDAFSNDVPIMWKWVYDLEGYYFRGTVNGNTATADEYLRPIEYDLDKATFERTNGVMTGALLTVDGDTVADFLADVTAHDGYSGSVDTDDAVTVGGSKYYPVEVDENGVGVWIYLLSYTEIEQAITYDSGLTSGDTFSANIVLSAVSVPSETRTVATTEELTTALADPDIDVVKLSGNLSIGAPIVLGSTVDKTLDLDGKTVTYNGAETEYSFITASEGSSVTVINGNIVGNGNGSGVGGTVDSVAVSAVGSHVTMSGVNVSGFDTALMIADEEGTGVDSEVRITRCTLNMKNLAIFIKGNGEASASHNRLIIENSTINGESYAGISGQGANGLWGTDIAINGSKISGYWTSIYLPARDTNAIIANSTLTGITGFVAKGGTVYMQNCTVTGTGAHVAAAESGGGWTDTGDGVYVEAVYNWNVYVNVDGGTVSSTNGHALELFGKDGAGAGSLVSSGSTLAGVAGNAHWNGKGTFTVNGSPVPTE